MRLIRVDLPTGEVEVLATSWFDAQQFPTACFAELYQHRWPIEEDYKLFKARLELENWSGLAYRTIQPYGIELFALRYQSAQLASLRLRMRQRENQPVKVKYHPGDLSRIYVYDPDEKVYIEAPALAQAYTQSLSLWKHNVICNFVLSERGAVDIAALGEAQRKVQAIVEHSLSRKKFAYRGQDCALAAQWQHAEYVRADKSSEQCGCGKRGRTRTVCARSKPRPPSAGSPGMECEL